MERQITIKKSPIVILRNFIVLELFTLVAFYIVAALADYGEIYRQYSFSKIIIYEFAYSLFIIIAEIVLVLLAFLAWSREFYRVNFEAVTHGRGVFFKKREVIQFGRPITFKYRNGIFSRMVKYGTLEIRGHNSGRPIVMNFIPDPERYAKLIMGLSEGMSGGGQDERIWPAAEDIKSLLTKGESEKLEYKMSLRWDFKKNQVSKDVERAVLKTAAAFLNSEGGQIIIGVDDMGVPVGIDSDLKSLGKPSRDGFENHFNNIFISMIGPEFRRFVKMNFHNIDGKDVCLVSVASSHKPAYVRTDEGENFFIRTGNSTTALRMSETAQYISTWWGRR